MLRVIGTVVVRMRDAAVKAAVWVYDTVAVVRGTSLVRVRDTTLVWVRGTPMVRWLALRCLGNVGRDGACGGETGVGWR